MRGFLLVLAACGGSSAGTAGDAAVDFDSAAPDGAPAIVDNDQDGLDDAYELTLATDYLPFISLDPDDSCPLSGLLVRVRKHPADATKILIVYDQLFETDCGTGGHTGDNEVFGVAIDPALPPPQGILAIKAASHQGTLCERVTECTTCSGDSRRACDLVASVPVLYPSKDKHGQYATKSQCGLGTCFDSCTLAALPHRPPIANAGEPDHPLISNLTTEGFITAANGWSKPEVMNVDPWAPGDFAGAGAIAGDLVDETFTAAPCN
ncbi:MAG: hypothetical protein ABI867_43830 [Kofleriaceae bacterium]